MTKLDNTSLLIGLILLIPAVFFGTTFSMAEVWATNETFTHGFIVFPISLWLIWQNRHQINQAPLCSIPMALVLALPVIGLWMLGALVDVKIVQQLALITLIPLSVWALLGPRVLSAALFPIGYLIFAVPLGQELIPPLMDFTAYFTVELIRLSGVPVYQDGLYFTLPSGNWSVVEECSGVRYLIASLALGTIYAYLSYNSFYKRIIFFLFAIAVPIIANGLRAYMIVMIGHLSGMKYAVGADHLLYGWVFFGIVIFLMFYIGSFWRDPQPEPSSSDDKPVPPPSRSNNISWQVVVLFSALLVATKLVTASLVAPPTEDFIPQYVEIPSQLGDWGERETIGFDWAPIFNNPDKHVEVIYGNNSNAETDAETDAVRVDIGFFRYQRDGAEAASSLNRLSDPYDGDWKIVASRISRHGSQSVQETELRKNNEKILVWSWYRVGNQAASRSAEAKIKQLFSHLLSGRRDASMMTLATDAGESAAAARDRLKRFKTSLETQVFE